jgi:hypothetical protein
MRVAAKPGDLQKQFVTSKSDPVIENELVVSNECESEFRELGVNLNVVEKAFAVLASRMVDE